MSAHLPVSYRVSFVLPWWPPKEPRAWLGNLRQLWDEAERAFPATYRMLVDYDER